MILGAELAVAGVGEDRDPPGAGQRHPLVAPRGIGEREVTEEDRVEDRVARIVVVVGEAVHHHVGLARDRERELPVQKPERGLVGVLDGAGEDPADLRGDCRVHDPFHLEDPRPARGERGLDHLAHFPHQLVEARPLVVLGGDAPGLGERAVMVADGPPGGEPHGDGLPAAVERGGRNPYVDHEI